MQAAIAEPPADRRPARAAVPARRHRPADGCDSAPSVRSAPSAGTPAARSPRYATLQVSHGLPPGGGRHHFFDATSFSMALSSIASASSFFSLAFSSSSAFSRLASDTSRPPILGLPLVEGRAADPVLAAHIRRLRPRLLLPQDPDDLFFREPAPLHRPSPFRGDGLYPNLEEIQGLRSHCTMVKILTQGPRSRGFHSARAASSPFPQARQKNGGLVRRCREPAVISRNHLVPRESRRTNRWMQSVRHSCDVAFLQRQAWLGAIERLDLALLVDREHDGMRRRIDVEPDHVAQLRRRSPDRWRA